VRGGVPDARARLLDEAAAARDVHQSVRAHRDHDREQLLHAARLSGNDTQAVPIGTACEGEELLILDEALRPVGDGQVGHLHIRGVGLSRVLERP